MTTKPEITRFSRAAVVLIASVFTLSACDKDDEDDQPMVDTITNTVVNNNNFSLLESAVVKADLATTLNGAGPFTVFAPDDNAFNASGINSGTIGSLSADALEGILLYHTLGSKVIAADVPAGPNAAVTTAGGGTVYVTKNSNGVFVNGWKVTTPDINASNGVIHSIERVLMPPAGTLVATAQANSNLTFLVAAVLRASEGTTNVAQVLNSAGPFTVFAPTNDAFIAAGFPTIASIQAADPNTLASILTYHVLSARAFSSDLVNGQELTTVNGGKLNVALGSGATVKGSKNTSASRITAANIVATNGVVHVIDQVLLP